MILLFLVTILLLIVQIALALIGFNAQDKLKRKYSKPIGSQLTPEKILSQNEKKFGKITLKISDQLEDVAFSENQLVLINKKDLNKNTLYTNYKFLYYFYLSLKENEYIRNYKIYQNIAFGVQIFFLIIAFVLISLPVNTFLIASFIIQLFLLIYVVYNYFRVSSFNEDVYIKSKKILDLDKVEEARVESLIGDLSLEPFEYPFEVILRLVNFIKP